MREARWWRYRWVAVVALFVGLYVVGRATGLVGAVDPQTVRRWVQDAGPWGIVVFLGAFIAGSFVQVPGLVFVAAAIYLYGRGPGVALGLAGALLAMTVTFVVVRAVGGQPLGTAQRPFVRRTLQWIDTRPVLTVAALRLVFWLAPPVTYALALTGVRLRHYVLGSLLGLALPLAGFALAFDWLSRLWLR